MPINSINAYEKHAEEFYLFRDSSTTGAEVIKQWSLNLHTNSEIIELACGAGLPVTQTLVNAGFKLWAIDSSPTLVSVFTKRFPNIQVKCETALESDYFQKQFDAAIAIGLIFLLNNNDQLKMLAKVSEILNPGAHFLFSAPIESGTWKDVITNQMNISLGQNAYYSALKKVGFQNIQCFNDSGNNNYYSANKIM